MLLLLNVVRDCVVDDTCKLSVTSDDMDAVCILLSLLSREPARVWIERLETKTTLMRCNVPTGGSPYHKQG